jgi:hypothetical protein
MADSAGLERRMNLQMRTRNFRIESEPARRAAIPRSLGSPSKNPMSCIFEGGYFNRLLNPDEPDFAISAVQSTLLFGAQIVSTRAITIRGDVVRWTGGAGAALGETLPDNCRALEIEGDTPRTGVICVQPGGRLALSAP